jgi:hypothetical protein
MAKLGERGMREEKSYNGDLMQKGTKNEEIILNWLQNDISSKGIIDFREFRLAQRIDVDFGIETIDGKIVLAEIKSDKWISRNGNLCFETMRINHFVDDKWFYLGWGWRSPAQSLIVRNPETNETYIFPFLQLRRKIASYISEVGRSLRTNITETDKQKTTFNFLIPMNVLIGIYNLYHVPIKIEKTIFET